MTPQPVAAHPKYPLELRPSPTGGGHIELLLDDGRWVWCGQKQNGRWAKIATDYALLLGALGRV